MACVDVGSIVSLRFSKNEGVGRLVSNIQSVCGQPLVLYTHLDMRKLTSSRLSQPFDGCD